MINMATTKTFNVPYRRKREGKTNYKRRLGLLKSEKPRLVVRISLKHATAQLINYEPAGDKILVSAHSAELSKLGWKGSTGNLPASYLTGYLIGKKAKSKNVSEAILDLGLRTSVTGSRVYAVLKGAVDAGLNVPHSDDILPSADRLSGKHIAEYGKKLKANKTQYDRQYSGYEKRSLNPEDITKHFDEMKKKIDVSIK